MTSEQWRLMEAVDKSLGGAVADLWRFSLVVPRHADPTPDELSRLKSIHADIAAAEKSCAHLLEAMSGAAVRPAS